MVSFVRKGLLALSVTIAASAILGVASAYAASGGGCTPSSGGVLQACISEDAGYFLLPDAYVNGYHFNCYLAIYLYENDAQLGPPSEYWFDGGGHFNGSSIQAIAGSKYYTVATLGCSDVGDWEQSPDLWA
jgi:hypothetical protein